MENILELSESAARNERILFQSLHKRIIKLSYAELLLSEAAEQWRQASELSDASEGKRKYARNRYKFCSHPTTLKIIRSMCKGVL